MGNMLLDMMGLLTRKKVTKTGEDQDFLVLGKTPKLDVDMMFTAPKMHNELIRLKDLKAYFDVGEISGSGSERTIPMFTASGDSIENSQLSQSPPLSNGLYQMKFDNCDRFFINKPSSVTGGDPEFLIKQDNNYKASFGWDDDGDGFAFLYNYSGAGIRLGAAGNNPVIEIKTTAGAEIVDIHKSVKLVDYGQGNKTGTATYNLSVDTDGNIIETAGGGGWLGITDVALNGTDLDFTSTASAEGGFNGSVDLSSLSGSGGLAETKGNWTPQLIAMSSSSTPIAGWNVSSYALRQGRWIRHGSLVQCEFLIFLPVANITKSSGQTGFITIQGWPYDAGPAGLFQDARTMQCSGFDVIATNFTYTYNNNLVGKASINLNTPTIVSGVHGIDTLKESNIPANGSLYLQGVLAFETSSTTLNPGATIQ